MATGSEIKIRITGDGSDFVNAAGKAQTAARQLSGSVGDIEKSSSSLTSSIAKLGGAMAAAFSASAVTSKLVAIQREFDVMNASLVTMTGSTEKAKVAFSAIQEFAATTPFSLQEVAGAFTKLTSLGLTPSQRALESYGNTASAMGKSLNQFIEAVADASTSEFERLKEFGIKAKQNGDTVALTFQGVTTTVKNSANEITEYLTKIGENEFAGAMEERAKTLDGAISNLADGWDNLFLTVSQKNTGGLIFDSVTLASGAVSDMTKIIAAMSDASSNGAQATGALAAAQNGLGYVLETVAVLGVNTAFVLTSIGREIGGIAAQAAAVLSGDFSGASLIGEEMRKDAANARAEVDALSERILGARSAAQAAAPSLDSLGANANRSAEGVSALGRAAKSSKSDFQAIAESAAKYAAELEATAAKGDKLTQAEKAMEEAKRKLTAAEFARIEPLLKANIESERSIKLAQEETAATKARADYLAQAVKGEQTRTESLKQSNKRLSEEVDTLGLSDDALQAYNLAKIESAAASEQAAAAELENAAALLESAGALPEVVEQYRQLADARRGAAAEFTEQAALSSARSMKQASVKAANDAERAWENFSRDIERSLTDSLFRAFEAGDSFGEAFAKSLQNTLKTTVLKLAVNFTMDLGKQLLGAGLNLVTGGSSGSGGGFGSLFSAASNASSIYGLLTGQTLNNFASMAGTASSLLTGGGTYGAAYGAGVTTTINAGTQAAQAAALAYQEASLAQAALGNAQAAAELAQAAQGISAGASTTGSTLGTLGSAMQTIGLVSLPMIIGGLIDKFGGGDKYQTGVALQGVFGADQKGGFDGIVGENYSVTSGWFHDGRDTVEYTDIDMTLKDMLGLLTGRASDKADGVLRGTLTEDEIKTLLGRVGMVVGEKTVQVPVTNPLGGIDEPQWLKSIAPERFVDKIVPVFKTAAEMTEEEIRANWTNLIDLNTNRYIDWDARAGDPDDIFLQGYGHKNVPGLYRQYGTGEDFDLNYAWDSLYNNMPSDRSDFAFVPAGNGHSEGKGEYLVSTNIQVYDFLSESLDKIYESTISAYRTLGEQLGATDIEAILDSYTGNINIQNVTGLEQLLNGAAQQLNEGIGKAIFPIIDELRAATGEAGTWADTFARVSGEAAAIGSAFKDLGLTMHNSGIANQLLATSVALTTAFGGLEGLNAALTSYYDNYYTAEEKRARTLRQLGDALRQGGLEITDSRLGEMTRAEFRSLYESIVETSGAAAPAAIAMLQMQGAFAQLTDAASTSTQKMADAARSLLAQQVTGQIGNNVAGWNAAADAGLAALEQAAQREIARAQAEQQRRQSEMDASRAAHNAVISSRIDMEQTRKQLAADSLSAARKLASDVARIYDVSGRAAADLYRGSDSVGPAQAAAAMRQVADMAAAARRGALPDADQLARLITSAQSGIGKEGASYYETERDKLVLAGHLSQIEASAGKQLPAAEQAVALAQKQLDSAAEQIEVLRKQLITQTASVELDQRAVTAANQALEAYREQINRLRGVEAATWSLDGSVEDVGKRIVAGLQAQAKTITDSIQAALAAQNISSTDAAAALQQLPTAAGVMVSNNGAVIAGNTVYRADGVVASTTQAAAVIYGAKREKSAQDFYSWAISAGYSGAMIEKLVGLPGGDMAKWARSNNLPAFAVGTDRVPADMLALVHQGERITPAAYTGQQEKLIADLITEVRRLQAIVASGNAEARRTADAVNGRPEAPLLVEVV